METKGSGRTARRIRGVFYAGRGGKASANFQKNVETGHFRRNLAEYYPARSDAARLRSTGAAKTPAGGETGKGRLWRKGGACGCAEARETQCHRAPQGGKARGGAAHRGAHAGAGHHHGRPVPTLLRETVMPRTKRCAHFPICPSPRIPRCPGRAPRRARRSVSSLPGGRRAWIAAPQARRGPAPLGGRSRRGGGPCGT